MTQTPVSVKTAHYRFASVLGAALLLLVLPLLTYYMWICMVDHGGALFVPATKEELLRLIRRVPAPTPVSVAVYGCWLLLQALLAVYAPGPFRLGTELPDGRPRLRYKMNGWFAFWATLLLLAVLVALGWLSPTLIYDRFGELLTTMNLFTFAFSLYLYFHGKAAGGNEELTGNPLYDYFLGTSLNPRVGDFDFKFFCESRPGLIGWVVVNLALLAAQYRLHGTVTTPMLLVVAFQFLYVTDYFYYEEAILTTWDIKHENFGWMLCWGSLVWVPCTYTLQGFYLVQHTHDIPVLGAVAIVLLNMTGYAIFRGSNLQKHRFRTDPGALIWGRRPEFIRARNGSLLLTSGFWGVARHLNYTGDLMIGLAWCLPCLFQHPLPYFYILYFAILLIHREWRDNESCRRKYGQDWEDYCVRVRWRLVPGIY